MDALVAAIVVATWLLLMVPASFALFADGASLAGEAPNQPTV
jgi:hypothetical protein